MNKYANSRAKEKIESISSQASIFDSKDRITVRCKFNFHYFTVQEAGQSFDDWTKPQLTELLKKLKNFSEDSLRKWNGKNLGSSIGHILEIYGYFPSAEHTDFTEPPSVPIEARWARFRLDNKTRVIGFIVPEDKHNTFHEKSGYQFDENTFYVVFLDSEHKFYKPEKK